MTGRYTRDNKLLRMLVYGPGGSGKSTFLSSFDQAMDGKRILIIECGGNPVSIIDRDPEPVVISISKFDEIEEVLRFLKNPAPNHPFRKKYAIPEDMVFGAVALDTLTEFQRLVTDAILPDENIALLRMPQLQEWGTIGVRTTHPVRQLKSLPYHVIITAQEKSELNDVTDIAEARPFIHGSASSMVPAYVELMARFVRKPLRKPGQKPSDNVPVVTTALLQPGPTWSAKNQVISSDVKQIIDITAAKILELL